MKLTVACGAGTSALSRVGNSDQHFFALGDAAKSAAETGEMVKAKRYAEYLLKLAPVFQRNWNYGNAIREGHMVLSRVALAAGDVATASERTS